MAKLNWVVCATVTALFVVSPVPGPAAPQPGDSALEPDLQRLYAAWTLSLSEPVLGQPPAASERGNPYLEAIGAKGLKAVPFLLKKLEAGPSPGVCASLIGVLSHITRVEPAAIQGPARMPATARAQRWVKWFRELDANTRSGFEEAAESWLRFAGSGTAPTLWTETTSYHSDLVELRTRKDSTLAGEAYSAVVRLGIPVLPLLVERLRAGQTCFVPIFEEITGSGAAVHAPDAGTTCRNCLAWWERNRGDWLIPNL